MKNATQVSVKQLIDTIETRQSVKNKETLSEDQLNTLLSGIAPVDKATHTDLSFIAQDSYAEYLADTQSGLVIIGSKHAELVREDSLCIVVASPYLAYASCTQVFEANYPASIHHVSDKSCNIHASAIVAETARIASSAKIGANVFIGEHVNIGEHCVIHSGVHIADGSVIGENCVIYANVSIAHDVKIGCHVRIHAGVSIGAEGFGFAPTANPSKATHAQHPDISLSGWERIAQLGTVVIGDYVRIGANTCIDRGAVDDTVIGDNVIIDNLVQIAHNVRIGAGTAIAAKTGIAGSAVIGKNCIIGGAVGIAGHLHIADGTTITAMSMITKSIDTAGSYSSGMPALPTKTWHKMVATLRMVSMAKNKK